MKKIKFLMILGVSIILIFIANQSFAESNKISILEYSQNEYAMYIKELLDKDFKYAFSDNNMTKENDLNYITSKKDSKGNSLIYLDKQEYEKYEGKDIYIWVKDGDNFTANAEKLDFSNSISRDEIVNLEHLTKLIDVQTDKKIETNTTENGIQKSEELGSIQFNNKDNKYYYQLLNVEDNQNYEELFNLVNQIKKDYSSKDIVEKINSLKQLEDNFKDLIKNANWQEVEKFQIIEPKDTKDGQKYILLLQQLGETEVFDIQLLNSTRQYEEKYITEDQKENEISNTINNTVATNQIENNAKPQTLPITYDSKILIVILAIIFVTIVFTWMRYKNLEKKSNDEK